MKYRKHYRDLVCRVAQKPSKTVALEDLRPNLIICEIFEFPEPVKVVNTQPERLSVCEARGWNAVLICLFNT